MKEKIILDDHSEAKVSLYSRYLSIYLNVLSRASIQNIFIVDFFCGEGVYENDGKGSPIVALECLKNHYFSNKNKCPNISINFNDSLLSEIEPTKLKIDRVKEFARNIYKPDNVNISYTHFDYQELLNKIVLRTNKLSHSERALLFIDPWGYKEIKANDLKELLSNGKTEIILFLPIYFMSRFAKKSKDESFKGGNALRNFIGELFGSINNLPHYDTQHQFIQLILQEFKKFLNLDYIDVFKIERDNNQWFALYFFTSNKKGFVKMLESKWSIDKKNGYAYTQGDKHTLDIFDEITACGYDDKVLNFLLDKDGATNHELFEFGLKNNFLPKHTNQVIDKLKSNYTFEITSLDGKLARSSYLGDENRLVKIKIKV
ncbi:MAG: three-Cys-motif partner protein TcmP [Saprospiraceae bacterium]